MRVPAVLFALPLTVLPLSAQAWDVRLEVPFPDGQSLPQTLVKGTAQTVSGSLDRGHGGILTVSHRIVRVGPVLKLEWGLEAAQFSADGQIQNSGTFASRLKQAGFGASVNAQFWVPFTGIAGEMALIQRFQNYQLEGAGVSQDTHLSRTWLRGGARWRFSLPFVSPYIAASYQEPLSKDKPVKVDSVSDLGTYLSAQGSGQEFQRMWTFGVGVQF